MPPKHGHGGGHKAEHSTGTPYAGGSADTDDRGLDFSTISQLAGSHAGDSGDSSMFSTALSMISGKSSQLSQESPDEEHLVKSHKKYYKGQSDGGEATESGMGGAAAMQALSMFNSSGGSSSSDPKQEFMGMAMGQAAKLFGKMHLPKIAIVEWAD